jgi:hypothetical protein
VLLPVYAAFAAAIIFYFLIPIVGAFRLRNRWRQFRERVAQISLSPLLRYGDLAKADREGRVNVGRFRLFGIIEAIEGPDRVWVRGKSVSALVDLSRAPLYVAAPGPPEAGSIERLRWSSVSSLVEGTNILVAGLLVIEHGRPVFVDAPGEGLIAVCHDGDEIKLVSRLIVSGRAPNEYWNYPTIISLALGVATISGILLLFRTSVFSTLRALIFLSGAIPILPFAPPGLALFFAYYKFWRLALASRTSRDQLRLPLHHSFLRRALLEGETPPEGSTWLGLPNEDHEDKLEKRTLTLLAPEISGDPAVETFVVEGDPEELACHFEHEAIFYAAAAGLSFGLAVLVNFALAFIIWRSVL